MDDRQRLKEILLEKSYRKGQRVEIELPGPDSRPARIRGKIRHVRRIDGHPHGIGIEFIEMNGPALQVIEDLMGRISAPEP